MSATDIDTPVYSTRYMQDIPRAHPGRPRALGRKLMRKQEGRALCDMRAVNNTDV